MSQPGDDEEQTPDEPDAQAPNNDDEDDASLQFC